MNIRRSLLATAVATVSITASQAATLTWDHDADGTASDGSGNWLDANKWLDGVTPATWNNATPDSAIIGSGGTGEWQIDLTGGVTVADATFDNYTGEYRLRSGSLTIAPGGTLTWGPNTGSNGEDKGGVEFEGSASLIGDATATIVVDGSYPTSKASDQFSIRSSNNTAFDGTYDVRNGVLFTENGRPNANSRIILNGGPGAGQGAAYSARWGQTLDRDLGTGAGQIQVIGNRSGFDGQGTSSLIVRLNGTGPKAVQWGDPNFDPSVLLLQTPNANQNGNLDFDTALDLNGADRTIEVDIVHTGNSGGGNISEQISNSDLINPAGIIKTGPGRLILSDSNNDYDGPTVINEGILQIGTGWNNSDAIPGGINGPTLPGSNLVINNSQLAVYFTFTRGIGTAGNEVQFTGARAGITQRQGDRPTFVFGDSSTEVVWGAPGFDPVEFVINDPLSGPSVNFRWQNPIDLNGADRTISTPSTSHGGTLEGDVRNTGAVAGLVKEGAGELILNGTNTYDGGTTINAGTVQFDKLVSMPANGAVTINSGTTLCVKVGGGGEWSTSGTGHGTVDGLLNGLGGQAPSTITNSGGNLCLLVSGSQTVSNVISSSGDFFVSGGTLELSGDNTFTGDVVIDNGATVILSGDNSGATGKIRIIDGFLELSGAGTLPGGGVRYDSSGSSPAIFRADGVITPDIGDGDDVYWNQNGGFAATSSALTVTPNAGATIDWSDGNNGFRGRELHMSSSSSTATVELTNDITLDGDRTVRAFNNSGSNDDLVSLSGNIVRDGSNNRSLTVRGGGTLLLPGTNDFGHSNKRLQISDNSVVRAADGVGLPSTAVLFFDTGRFESSGTFTRDISNVSGNVYWNGRGGFAAQGGPLTVDLQGAGTATTLDWNATNGGFRGQELYMGSDTADDVVTWIDNIDLKNNRNIRTYDNPDTDADYTVFSGVFANGDGSNRNLEFRGNGTVLLNGDNTYTGETRVHDSVTFGGTGSVDGKLRMEGSTKLSPGASVGTFGVAGNLELDPLAGNSNGKLLFELGPIAASDKIEVGGEINIGGSRLDLDDFEFTELAGLENGTYTLISGGAPVNGSLNSNTNGTLGLATIDLQISGSGTDIELVVSGLAAGSPFDTWAGTGSLGPVTFDGDTNGDGVQDGIAFLLGVGNPDDDANGNLPAVSEDGSGNLVMTFECLAIADRGTATLNVQHSSDLAAWAPLPNGVLVPDASGGPTDGVTFVVGDGSDGPGGLNGVTATIDSSLASGGKLFGRLNGTE